jgi:hypothetical protein
MQTDTVARTPLQIPPLKAGVSRLDEWRRAYALIDEAGPLRKGIARELAGRFAVAAVIEQAQKPGGLLALHDGEAARLAFGAASHVAEDARGELRHLVHIQGRQHSNTTVAFLQAWQAQSGRLVFEPVDGLDGVEATKRAMDAGTCAEIACRAPGAAELPGYEGWQASARALHGERGVAAALDALDATERPSEPHQAFVI